MVFQRHDNYTIYYTITNFLYNFSCQNTHVNSPKPRTVTHSLPLMVQRTSSSDKTRPRKRTSLPPHPPPSPSLRFQQAGTPSRSQESHLALLALGITRIHDQVKDFIWVFSFGSEFKLLSVPLNYCWLPNFWHVLFSLPAISILTPQPPDKEPSLLASTKHRPLRSQPWTPSARHLF